MAATIRTAADWAEALDKEMRFLRVTDHRACSFEIITWAYVHGSAAGVEIVREADAKVSRRLASADGRWIVRYDEPNDWWVPELTAGSVRLVDLAVGDDRQELDRQPDQ
jgi:hypothetical protein